MIKTSSFKNVGFAFCIATTVLLQALLPANAEGGDKRTNGNWGVNRRVVSKAGYSQVEGKFNVKFGPNLLLGAKSDTEWEILKNEPTAYMGGHGEYKDNSSEVEVDAGLQYGKRDAGIKDGWEIFMRVTAFGKATRFAKMLTRDPATGKDVNWNSISTSVSGELRYTIDEDSGQMKLLFSPVGEAFFYGSGKGLITTQVITNPVGGSVPAGSSLIRVKSTAGIEAGDDLVVGKLGSTFDANDLKEITSNKEEFLL